ncbi:unnamed protein product [Gadus morhua 'NCC']
MNLEHGLMYATASHARVPGDGDVAVRLPLLMQSAPASTPSPPIPGWKVQACEAKAGQTSVDLRDEKAVTPKPMRSRDICVTMALFV